MTQAFFTFATMQPTIGASREAFGGAVVSNSRSAHETYVTRSGGTAEIHPVRQRAAFQTTSEIPVTVRQGKVHVRDEDMRVGEFYLLPYRNRTLAIRKSAKGTVQVYELPG